MGQEQGKTTRRDFIRNAAVTTAAGVIAASVMPTTAEGMRRVLGANDRISVGHIGVGNQGFNAHMTLMTQAAQANNTQHIAACDLYNKRVKRAQALASIPDSQAYTDYRKLLDNKNVDAVVIATSDNWHATITVAALQAGKHVYCEKPLSKTLDEAFLVYDTVKKTGKKFQVGAQRCTQAKYKAIADLVKSGKYGQIVLGQASYMRGDNKIGEWNDIVIDPTASPNGTGDDHIDWETFRKGTSPAEFDPDRFFRWRKYWDYGSGPIGDLIPHPLHPLLVAMAMPMSGTDGFPTRVSCGGGLYVQKINPDTKKVDREVPDFININVDYPDKSIMVASSTITEQGWPDSIRLNKATILFTGSTIDIKPDRMWADDVDGATMDAPGEQESIPAHEKNWFDAIRNNTEPSANIELAIRVQTILTLAERSYRESRTFTFDAATRQAKSA